MAEGYAGGKTPRETWDVIESDKRATLVDVRTQAEFDWVGVPDLSSLGKKPQLVPWQRYPGMAQNESFVGEVKKAQPDKDAPIFFICRSGARSRSAAILMTAAGYTRCYNVSTGFEGNPDDRRHRGTVDGWKMDGLPWVQT
jgi:rhodanese-related sulfurtransferase